MQKSGLLRETEHAGPVYFDVTDLVAFYREHEQVTGIQRVVCRVIQSIVREHGVDAVRLIRWDPYRQCVVWYPADIFAHESGLECERFLAYFGAVPGGPEIDGSVADFVKLQFAGIHRKLGKWRRLPQFLARLTRGSVATARQNLNEHQLGDKAPSHPFAAAPGVTIVYGGGNWAWPAYLEHMARMHDQGAHVVQIVYDLIPLLFREHFVPETLLRFSRWLESVCRSSGTLVTISQCTRNDLEAYRARNGLPRVPIRVVPLAHEFIVEDPATSTNAGARAQRIRPEVQRLAREPFVLFASTIEPRKNADKLVRAYASVARRLGAETPRLVLAGRKGWLTDRFDAAVAETGALDGLLTLVPSPSDAELGLLYENCMFLVYPSRYEGWGLPIGEALWHGRPVAASATSAMPEVAGDLVRYFNPDDVEEMADVIASMIEDSEGRKRVETRIAAARAEGRFRTWKDVADEIWRVAT